LCRRIQADRREKVRLGGELEAARTVQGWLLTGEQPGIDAVCLPAAEVGGDFWHVFDNRLIVAGDVSGKGLRAAMIVSVITGALRNRRSDSPAKMLAELNAVVQGSGGFVTCCIVRLEPDGQLTAANAGHPAPYLQGMELELSPGLPLGIAAEVEYTETTVAFEGSLTLVSDGVIEAANAKGELFGFDRTREISTRSAQEIAEAAKVWGQNDDITVVTVRRST
jgi:serine phosphatase RsbU (regulator of sigma subunit)